MLDGRIPIPNITGWDPNCFEIQSLMSIAMSSSMLEPVPPPNAQTISMKKSLPPVRFRNSDAAAPIALNIRSRCTLYIARPYIRCCPHPAPAAARYGSGSHLFAFFIRIVSGLLSTIFLRSSTSVHAFADAWSVSIIKNSSFFGVLPVFDLSNFNRLFTI